MKNTNKKEDKFVSPELGEKDRFIPCMQCGSNMRIIVDRYDEYIVECTHCDFGIGTNRPYVPGENAIVACRPVYNRNVLDEWYTQQELERFGVKALDYVITDAFDGHVLFRGPEEEAAKFYFAQQGKDFGFSCSIYYLYSNGFIELNDTALTKALRDWHRKLK